MNWLTSYVRPKLQSLVGTKEIPDNLWEKCPSCGAMVYHRELEQNFRICPQCNHHMRLSPEKRLEMLFDEGAYTLIELPEVKEDPLNFSDLKDYSDRLKEARKKTKQEDAILVASGKMGGMNVVAGILNFDFMGGSMGTAVGESIIAAVELALLQEASLLLIPASGGARMQEGILSLMQMARTTMAVRRLKEKGLPYFVLLTDPTMGGVSASFAMLGDIAIAEPGALIGFAGARVIEQTIRTSLPEGFQKAEYLMEHGMVDMVVDRRKIRSTLINLIDLLRNPHPASDPIPFVRKNES
ncbi:MAG: acetyl-CoA carboxylase carboxyltransferase subunit beta [Alphaproteobacteria bacterium]|nr:acetyl-CoA carboxylase carboxyltransferase subunit beta [Alphaproteobacteria bacterium]MBO4643697.1 acetyl-CoA carboxylase carboxyltransferase subunit beta [Alphaproteobacteria bacterium]